MVVLKREANLFNMDKINRIRDRIYNKITMDPFAFTKPKYVADLNDYIGIVGKNHSKYDSILKAVGDSVDKNKVLVFRMAISGFSKLRESEKDKYPDLKYPNKFKILKVDQPFDLELGKSRNDFLGVDYYLVVNNREVNILITNSTSTKFKNIYKFSL